MATFSDDEVFLNSPGRFSDEEVFGAASTMPGEGKTTFTDEEIGLAPKAEGPGVLDYAREVGTSAVEGAKGIVASSLQGAGAFDTAFDRRQVDLMDRIDRGEKVTPREDVLGYGSMSPEQRVQFRQNAASSIDTKTKEHPLYKAGEAVSEAGKEYLGPGPGFEGRTWTRDIGGGLGSVAAGIGMGLVPFVGVPAAGGTFLTAGMGEAAERAVKAGATEDQIARATTFGSVPGATDTLDALLPMLGSAGKVMGFAKRVGVGALKSAFIEGGQEGVQQLLQNSIAKGIYKPEQDLTEDVARSAAVGFLVGGGVGGVAGGLNKGPTPVDPASAASVAAASQELGGVSVQSTPDEMRNPPLDEFGGRIRLSQPLKEGEEIPPTPVKRIEEGFDAIPKPVFYSTLRKTVEEKLPDSFDSRQALGTIRNAPGIKQEELEATGVEAFLNAVEGKVSKADLIAHLEENQVQVKDVTKKDAKDLEQITWTQPVPGTWEDQYLDLRIVQNTNGFQLEDAFDRPIGTFRTFEEASARAQQEANYSYRSTQDNAPQYEAYTTPGPRTGYTELLLTLPSREEEYRDELVRATQEGRFDDKDEISRKIVAEKENTYQSSHWGEPNVVSHVRFTSREDSTGAPILLIEEIQSDWHQAGREKGYRANQTLIDAAQEKLNAAGNAFRNFLSRDMELSPQEVDNALARAREGKIPTWVLGDKINEHFATDYINAFQEQSKLYGAVPDAPFKSSWPDLTIKRMLRWAADNGYNRISWASGTEQIRRYPGLSAEQKKGLIEFYDKILPSRMKYWAKKFGGTYGETVRDVAVNIPAWDRMPNETAHVQEVNYGGMGTRWTITERNGYGLNTSEFGAFGSREEAQEILDAVRGVRKKEVVPYIEVPPSSMSVIQSGLPLFQRQIEAQPMGTLSPQLQEPFIEPKNSPVQTTASARALMDSQKMGGQYLQIAEIVQDFVKRFKMTHPVRVRIVNEPNADYTGFFDGTAGVELRITMNVAKIQSAARFYSTAMHELGHALQYDVFNNLSESDQLLIRQAHKDFIANTPNKQSLREFFARSESVPGAMLEDRFPSTWNSEKRSSTTIGDLSPESRRYFLSFEEWFAESVARWATADATPRNRVEKIFRDLGVVLRNFLQFFQKKYMGLPEANFNAAPSMAAWLNSFMTDAAPFAGKIYEQLDKRSQYENGLAIERGELETAPTPRVPETIAVREGIKKLFGQEGVPVEASRAFAFADKMNFFYKWMIDVTQLARLNPQLVRLQHYVEHIRAANIEEAKVNDAFLRVAKDWKALKGEGDRLVGLLDDVTNMVYRTDEEVRKGVARHPTEAELATLLRKHEIGAEGLRVFRRVNQVFDISLQLTETSAIEDAQQTISNPAELAQRVDEIKAKTAALRRAPYFPFMRFGKHVVIVRDGAGRVVNRLHVERRGVLSAERMQKKVAEEMRRKYPSDHKVQLDYLDENAASMAGMPGNLLDMMETRLQLTPQQRDALEQLRYELSPAQSFLHRFQHKNYVQGYSMDFKRSFANYGFHFGKWYTKTKYATRLREEIKGIRKETLDTSTTPVKRKKIANFLEEHLRKDFLEPNTDFVHLKGALVMWTLAFVPSSAFVNMSQTPMVTFPYLAAKFGGLGVGNVRASRALLEAMASVKTFYKRGRYVGDTAFEMRALDYGVRSGRIIESMAPELAGMAEGNNLKSGFGGNQLQRGYVSFMEKGMWMFGMAEQMNRRIAYRAALKLAMRHPKTKIIDEAVAANPNEYKKLVAEFGSEIEARAVMTANYVTEQTQFMYDRTARPKIMRGKLGTLFMYKKFIQSTLFLNLSNKKDFLPQYVIMAIYLGGLMGVPGSDDLKDMIRLLAHWMFGKDFDVERKVKEFVMNVTGDPEWGDLLLHGAARKGFGVPHILNMAGKEIGFPPLVPEIDMSRAMSPGPLTPIEIGKTFGPTSSIDKVLAEQTQRAGGVPTGVAFNIYKALQSQDDFADFKRWERAVPRFMGNVSKGWRAYSEGMERNRTGAAVVKFDVRDPQQAAEVIGMTMGFTPARLSKKWEEIRMSNEAVKYADIRRNLLLRQHFEVVAKAKDPEEKTAVLDGIRRFNLEYPSKAITADTLKRSADTRLRNRALQEQGIPQQKSNSPIVQEVQKLFPNAVDVRSVR